MRPGLPVLLSVLIAVLSTNVYAANVLLMETADDTTAVLHTVNVSAGAGIDEQIDDSWLIGAPIVDLAFGIGPWSEVGLNYEILTLQDSDAFGDHTGSGDLRIRVKAIPVQTPVVNLGFSVIGKVPMADNERGLGTDEVDLVLKGIAATRRLGDIELFVNLGLALQGDVISNSSQNDYFIWSVGGRVPVFEWVSNDATEGLWLLAEIDGSVGSDENINIAQGDYTDRAVEVRAGIVKELKWFSIGVSGSAGITEETEDWSVRLMVSRSFDLPRVRLTKRPGER